MRHSSRKNLVSKSWEYRKGEPWGWLYDATPRKETIHNFPSQKNSILSDRVKTKMYLDHKKDPVKYSSENLAKEYMVREQRIMAILALKRREAEWIKSGKELDYDLEARFERAHAMPDHRMWTREGVHGGRNLGGCGLVELMVPASVFQV